MIEGHKEAEPLRATNDDLKKKTRKKKGNGISKDWIQATRLVPQNQIIVGIQRAVVLNPCIVFCILDVSITE